jgi:hypothetical protein
MLFQPIDDKGECVGIYADGRLVFDESGFPPDLTRTWRYSGSLRDRDIEYAWLYAEGAGLADVCPDNIKEEWARICKKMTAYKKSFDIAKINMREHCFFDLVPHDTLKELCELKNQITDYVFQNYERPQNYDHMCSASRLIYDIKFRDLNLDVSDCKSLFASGLHRAGCQKLLAGPKHIEYNLFGTVTGRLSTNASSFPILTMKKELRRLVKPHNDWFLSLDYNGAEIRTLMALSGQKQPTEDIHEWNIRHVFKNPDMHREEAKTLFFSWLYNPDSKQIDENYYDRTSALDNHYKDGYITTVFGRHLKVGEWKAFNYLIQSTTSDLVIDRALAIDKLLERRQSHISHIVHDEIVIDLCDKDRDLIEEIKEVFSNNKLGKFLVNTNAGKNYYDLKRLTL